MTAREFTENEVRERFLKKVWSTIDYWSSVEGISYREKMEGLAFSMLVILDGGSSMDMPGFVVSPHPHPDDKEFSRGEGENWYPQISKGEACDIAGSLHEQFHGVGRSR